MKIKNHCSLKNEVAFLVKADFARKDVLELPELRNSELKLTSEMPFEINQCLKKLARQSNPFWANVE